jgi:hypothetical protein
MTPEQTERVVDALEGVHHSLKMINAALIDIYARMGTLDDELDIWVPTAREYHDDG